MTTLAEDSSLVLNDNDENVDDNSFSAEAFNFGTKSLNSPATSTDIKDDPDEFATEDGNSLNENKATTFVDSVTKLDILLHDLIDDYDDAITPILHKNRIFDIFALSFLSPESIMNFDFDGNKTLHRLGWSYKVQLLQLAEYIRSFYQVR